MGLLIEGKWHDRWYDTKTTNGHFVRQESSFRNWITKDGSAGQAGQDGFKAESGRYHLYVSLACPWAHRTLIFRALKGLEEMVSVSVVHALMGSDGWTFLEESLGGSLEGSSEKGDNKDGDKDIRDPIHHADHLHQIYTAASPNYTGRVTVPVLWDKKRNTIVSNESSEIIRMFNSAFDEIGATNEDFYPHELSSEIDSLNEFIYTNINNGVYRVGFATTQAAYEEALNSLFNALDKVEALLSSKRYLTGKQITEADWRLFTTLIRFDAVYVGHFKCNLRQLKEYPNLWGYVRELYQIPKIAETVNFKHIKDHYYQSHSTINPTGIVPLGPVIDFNLPHGRGDL